MQLLELTGLIFTPKRLLKCGKLPCTLYYIASTSEDKEVQIKGRNALDCRGKNTAATVTPSVTPDAVYINGNIC